MSKRTFNLLLGLGLLLIVVGVIVALLRPSEPDRPIDEELLASLPGDAFGKIDNFSYTKSESGRPLWRVDAARAEYFQDQNRASLDTVTAVFFDKDGRVFTLKGAHGEMDTLSQNITVSGGIIATTSDGYELITTSAHYDRQQGIVSTDDPVLFFGQGITVHSQGLEVRVEDQQVTLKGAVRALISERSTPSNPEQQPTP